ncbi:MAG: hypothetical protein KBS81_01860 [Spirochaetales bacterium]|nr:hypothetical protein [Candidatus Physcosoma equi]
MMEGYYNEEEIRIALQEEHDEILTEEITKKVTEEITKTVRKENLRRHVLAMKNNGYDADRIAELLDEPAETVRLIFENKNYERNEFSSFIGV